MEGSSYESAAIDAILELSTKPWMESSLACKRLYWRLIYSELYDVDVDEEGFTTDMSVYLVNVIRMQIKFEANTRSSWLRSFLKVARDEGW